MIKKTLKLAVASITLTAVSAVEKPNIVMIFADDLGYGDLSCYGATKLKTPNIDRLASEGRKFTDAHSASAVCSPSRYGMMTGRYPHLKNYWGPVTNSGGLTIETSRETLSSVAKKAGYQTAFFGKWHLGFGDKRPNWNSDLKPGPLELGFDYFYGIPCANSVPPYVYIENHRVVGLDPEDPIGQGGKIHAVAMPGKGAGRISGAKVAHDLYVDSEIGTNLTERSVKWIEEAKEDEPFFLILSTTNIHHPFTPHAQFEGKSDCGIYGDFVQELDWMTGQVMDALEAKGVAENTLVIFTSDNGGMLNEVGQDTVKLGHEINGDLQGSKFGAWEGGHRVPMVVRWPSQIPAGTTSDALISHIDFLATFAGVMKQPLTDAANSLDQIGTLTGSPSAPVRNELVICPNSPLHLSIREGDWVYIPRSGEGGFQASNPGAHNLGGYGAVVFQGKKHSDIENGKLKPNAPAGQLYNLADDPKQEQNVYDQNPEKVKELSALLDAEYAKIPDTPRIGWINIRLPKKK